LGPLAAALDAGGKAAPVSALVQIQTILSGVRVRLTANLARNWGPSAQVVRSSIKVLGAQNAAAMPGDIYLTRSINIGTDAAGGAVVLRRSLNSGLARIYYRDGYQPTWRETGWSLRRTGGDIPAGFADYEYILPMRGDGWLRMDVEGEAMTIAHVVALGSSTGLGGFINPDLRPATPLITSPLAAATGVMERPTLALAAYATPSGNAQDAVQFQLSKDAAFATVLHDSGALPAGLSYGLPAGVLPVGTVIYWRARVRDVAGLWSDYSVVSSFTTAASFAYVLPPTITGPAVNAVDVPEQPTIATSAFAATAGATDTHTASQVQIRSANGTYAAPVWDSGRDTVNKLSMVPPAGKLLPGQSGYFVRARHEGSAKGWSEWSTESKFTTKAQFANVIGIALLAAGGGSGTWSRVDESGAAKVTDAAFFSSHAVYGAIQEVTIDGQAMVKIPAFYVKAGTIAAGPNIGKRAWWISDQLLPGYSLHPAFMEAGAPIAQFWVGAFQANSPNGTNRKLFSLNENNAPITNLTFTALKTLAAARNVGGVTGFSIWSYYQLQALQLLMLIELGGADVQALVAQGNYLGPIAVVNHEMVITAAWRGIKGLWGNVYQLFDGLKLDSNGRLLIWDKSGNKTFQTTNLNGSLQGFIVEPATDSGANYDLSMGLLAATVDRSSANSTLGDIWSCEPSSVLAHGGSWEWGAGCGMFAVKSVAESNNAGYYGTRLAKV